MERMIPAEQLPAPNSRRAGGTDRPFQLIDIDGTDLAQFSKLSEALEHYNANPRAVAVSLGADYVVIARRAGGVA